MRYRENIDYLLLGANEKTLFPMTRKKRRATRKEGE